jgi:predicted nucleic acid-binding protein
MKFRLVLDTNVLVTALCNREGASHLLIRWALTDRINVSLNQFIVLALAEKVSSLKTEAFFRERAVRANHEKAWSILDSVRKLPPDPGDELPS